MFHVLCLAVFPIAALAGCLAPFRKALAESWKELALLGGFSFGLLWPLLLNGESLVQKDANLLQIPFLQNYQLCMREIHQPPLWNPSLWLGTPSLAHPLFSLFYPASILALALPVHAAFAWGLFGLLFFSGAAMLLLARTLGCGRGASLVAGAAYSLGEFTLDRMGAPTGPGIEYLYSYAFVPLAAALALRAVGERRLLHAMLFGLSLLFVLNGNPNLLYYTAILCAILLAARVLAEPTRGDMARASLAALATLTLGGVVMLLAGAVELIPGYEHLLGTGGSRLSGNAAGWRIAGISWSEAGSLFMPHLPSAHFAYGGRIGWVGLALAVTALAWWRPRDGQAYLMMTLSLAAGLLFVTHGFLYSLMAGYAPFFGRISMVPAVFILFSLPLSMLAGLGAERLSQVSKVGRALPLVLALLVFGEGLGAARGWLPFTRFTRLESFDMAWEWRDFPHLDAVAPASGTAAWRIECRALEHAMLCPDYALIPRGLRLVDGDRYQFPSQDAKRLADDAGSRRDHLDLRYVLSSEPLDDADLALKQAMPWQTQARHREMGLREATSAGWQGTVYIYESRRRFHAYLVEEGFPGRGLPAEPASFEVAAFAPGRIELSGHAPRPGTLFVSEPYYPGWRATVDGADASIVRLDGGFMGVVVDAGTSQVVLEYEPVSFTLGFWVTALTLTAVLGATALGFRRPNAHRPSS